MPINPSYKIPTPNLEGKTLDQIFSTPIRGIQKNTLLSGGALNMETEAGHLNMPILDIADKLYGLHREIKASGVSGSEIMEVGPGKTYASIQSAWNALMGKVIDRNVKIKVADGTYEVKNIWLGDQPYASRISIEGNIQNPQNCVIRFKDKRSPGWVIHNCQGLNISGFRLEGVFTSSQWVDQGFYIGGQSLVSCKENSIQIDGTFVGVLVTQMSNFSCTGIHIRNFGVSGVRISDHSAAHIHASDIKGQGRDWSYIIPKNINPAQPSATQTGLLLQDGGSAWAEKNHIRDVREGVASLSQSYAWCDNSIIEDVVVGLHAAYSGKINCFGEDTKINRAKYAAVNAYFNGAVYCPNIHVHTAQFGYFSNNNGYIFADHSHAHDCEWAYRAEHSSAMRAYDTGTRGSGNKIAYSPPTSGVAGNVNSAISWS